MTAAAYGEAREQRDDGRLPVLYLAPWVDYGGSDKGTIDWFRWLDRDRFAPSLITTQPSDNRRLNEITPFAEEVWALPDHFSGEQFPRFIFDFIHTRGIRVLHIMNARLGFELLPDLAALPAPPRTVVQLHVEEADRSGYVRYVTTRFGNLVDAFSVTSHHLARAMADYDVPSAKLHVIPTGVDAASEFNPERVRGIDDGEPGVFRILFPGRLTEQKDPLLALEVIRRVADRHPNIRFDIVGDGSLGEQVSQETRRLGLDSIVRMHPATNELARWLRVSDLLLMTSVFEGVPYVVYEAMAMEVPVVAPALPGNVELMTGSAGRLIDDRTDVSAYAEAISTVIENADEFAERARAERGRMLRSFSLRQMAAAHEALYDDLVATLPPPNSVPKRPYFPPVTFENRPTSGTPLVSVVTPCFNHGLFLEDLLGGLESQDYPELEIIIVDDGSTDPDTVRVLREIDQARRARVVWQPRNRGPSATRNRAIKEARGRYILPVDADNVLLPGAVSALVSQLQAAGERVGFIYPSFQYFGTRDYQFDAPPYNLFALLHGNFADTCSLIDSTIFDAGLGFAEDIKLGHEDWDLALTLAAHRIIGEPSIDPVMRYRKQGFTRSDAVEYLRRPFRDELRARHPELFGVDDEGWYGWYRGPAAAIKARWNPALSIILADPVDFDEEGDAALLAGAERQTCRDFELIVQCETLPSDGATVIRRLPPGLSSTRAQRLQDGLDASRGRYLMFASSAGELLADPAAVEKFVRATVMDGALGGVALADLGDAGRYPFRALKRLGAEVEAHTVMWRRDLHVRLHDTAIVADHAESADIAEALMRLPARMRWHHFPSSVGDRGGSSRSYERLALERPRPLRKGIRDERRLRFNATPAVPAVAWDCVPRWMGAPAWMPPETLPLVRHRETATGKCLITNDRRSPPGFEIEWDIGSVQRFAPPGTVRLLQASDGELTVVPRGTQVDAELEVLGYLEQVAFPLFQGVHRIALPNGSVTLALATQRDPLYAAHGPGDCLGFIEMFPAGPPHPPPTAELPHVSLVRIVDRAARRHRYAAARDEEALRRGVVSAELGELRLRDGPGLVALWLDSQGWVMTDAYRWRGPSPTLAVSLRWAGAPARWRGLGHRRARPRAVARRLYDVAAQLRMAQSRRLRSAPLGPGAQRPMGYIHAQPGPGRTELFAAVHPVLSDQFLTVNLLEATDMGYGAVTTLGYIDANAPLTKRLGGRGDSVAWASRFGLTARLS